MAAVMAALRPALPLIRSFGLEMLQSLFWLLEDFKIQSCRFKLPVRFCSELFAADQRADPEMNLENNTEPKYEMNREIS